MQGRGWPFEWWIVVMGTEHGVFKAGGASKATPEAGLA